MALARCSPFVCFLLFLVGRSNDRLAVILLQQCYTECVSSETEGDRGGPMRYTDECAARPDD